MKQCKGLDLGAETPCIKLWDHIATTFEFNLTQKKTRVFGKVLIQHILACVAGAGFLSGRAAEQPYSLADRERIRERRSRD